MTKIIKDKIEYLKEKGEPLKEKQDKITKEFIFWQRNIL